jgi:two-component system LytT family sensor kinase
MLVAVAQTVARRVDLLRLSRERCEQRVREADVRRLATEAELRALRAQVNPHFLFNALTTIGYFIQTAPPVAVEKLIQLTELLRRVLRSEGEFTTLGKEIELIRLYLEIEQSRFEERLRIQIDVPPSLFEIPVPALILQPIVENAIKHGIASQVAGGWVKVTAALETADGTGARPRLIISVRDTGRGVRQSPTSSGGIGLRNVEQRLHLHYGDQACLTLDSDDTGTRVTLVVPAVIHRTDPARIEAQLS